MKRQPLGVALRINGDLSRRRYPAGKFAPPTARAVGSFAPASIGPRGNLLGCGRRFHPLAPHGKEFRITKNRNTYAKRAREMEKKRKAEAKRANRRQKVTTPGGESPPDGGLPEKDPEARDLPE